MASTGPVTSLWVTVEEKTPGPVKVPLAGCEDVADFLKKAKAECQVALRDVDVCQLTLLVSGGYVVPSALGLPDTAVFAPPQEGEPLSFDCGARIGCLLPNTSRTPLTVRVRPILGALTDDLKPLFRVTFFCTGSRDYRSFRRRVFGFASDCSAYNPPSESGIRYDNPESRDLTVDLLFAKMSQATTFLAAVERMVSEEQRLYSNVAIEGLRDAVPVCGRLGQRVSILDYRPDEGAQPSPPETSARRVPHTVVPLKASLCLEEGLESYQICHIVYEACCQRTCGGALTTDAKNPLNLLALEHLHTPFDRGYWLLVPLEEGVFVSPHRPLGSAEPAPSSSGRDAQGSASSCDVSTSLTSRDPCTLRVGVFFVDEARFAVLSPFLRYPGARQIPGKLGFEIPVTFQRTESMTHFCDLLDWRVGNTFDDGTSESGHAFTVKRNVDRTIQGLWAAHPAAVAFEASRARYSSRKTVGSFTYASHRPEKRPLQSDK